MQTQVFERWGADYPICNCIYGVHLVLSEDMARAFARAVNDWIATQWLAHDERLLASIVIPLQNVEFAVAEIERCAADPRFVQIWCRRWARCRSGRRSFWPSMRRPNATACRSAFMPAVPTAPRNFARLAELYIEDYAAQSQGFQSQVTSLIAEGVFTKHPRLWIVLMKSEVRWVPPFLWRMAKSGAGCAPKCRGSIARRMKFSATISGDRAAVRRPGIARHHPHTARTSSSALLLHSSDYPHWQFDGDHFLPAGIPHDLARKILVDNPRATYFNVRRAGECAEARLQEQICRAPDGPR